MTMAEAVAMSLVGGFTSMSVILPSMLVGWLSRSGWQAMSLAAVAAFVVFLLSIAGGLPEGAAIPWWAVPASLVAPCAWALATFLVASRIRGRAARDPADIAVRIARAAVGALVGAIVIGAAALALGVAYVEVAEVGQFEGAAGYLVFLGFACPGAVAGFVLGAVLGWRRKRPQPSAI